MKFYYLLFITAAIMLFTNCLTAQRQEASPVLPSQITPAENQSVKEPASEKIFSMKGVGIVLPQADFVAMKSAGISVISTEWGMEEGLVSVRKFLDQAQSAGLKVVMDGGFSYTAWGFTDDDWESLPAGKRPVWQKERVQNWINALKDHPAIYAWDISNEFGENLPSGAVSNNPDWPKSMITLAQLKQARADVLAVDPTRPIMARVHGWDIGEMPPYVSAMLDSRIADVISLNLYSNYLYNGKLQWPDVIKDGGKYFVDSIKKRAPNTKIWLALATFEYLDTFQRPTPADLSRDMKYTLQISDLDGISFFCWGPVNQWDEKCNWYLPKTDPVLWEEIQQEIKLASQVK